MNHLFSIIKVLKSGVLSIGLLCLVASCSSKNKTPQGNNEIQIVMDSIVVRDSVVDAANIKIIVSSDISYPKSVKIDGVKKSSVFLSLYFKSLLESDFDSNAKTTIKSFVARQLDSYKSESVNKEALDDEDGSLSQYSLSTIIRSCYHDWDFICFCKTTTTIRDDKQPISTNQYITLDIKGNKQVHITDIFNEKDFTSLTEVIRNKLFADNNCKNANQLAELGFFNIDNLFVPDNFSLTDKAITFHYNPLEIACNAIGVVSVDVPFDSIQQYIIGDSPIKRIIE